MKERRTGWNRHLLRVPEAEKGESKESGSERNITTISKMKKRKRIELSN